MKNIDFSLFFKVNLIVTILFALFFMLHNDSYSFLSFILTILGVISSVAILYMLLYIILIPFFWLKNGLIYFSALVFIIVDIALVVDFFIFQLYKFHINGMVINIITSPDAMDSMQIGIYPILVFSLFILVFIAIEFYLISKIVQKDFSSKETLNKKINKKIFLPIVLLILSEKITYGFASLLNNNEIMSKFTVIPFYHPLTFNRIAAKYFGFKPDVDVTNVVSTGKLIYPRNELHIADNPNAINIFIIASDAVRNSILNDEVSPNIEKFKQDSLVFENHFSGGNATRFGIFSLMYGVNGTYWFDFLNNSKGSVLFDILKKLDYQIDIVSSTNTNWPEFRKTCYVNILKNIKDDFVGVPWEKDKQSSEYFMKKVDSYTMDKPIFSFVFFDSPHGYSYPQEFNKFNAQGENINYLNATKGSDEIKGALSRYKNSVAYNDKLFGDIIEKIKEKGLYENSLIIFTSDHGQEFYEYGNFGHNSAFSKAQTNSPLIVKLPKSLKSKLQNIDTKQFTSHIDVVPTILNMIGLKNPIEDYSNGYDIFDKNQTRKYVFVANWNNNAVIARDYTYVFSNTPDKMFKNEIRDTKDYRKVENQKIDSEILLDIINQNKRFMK